MGEFFGGLIFDGFVPVFVTLAEFLPTVFVLLAVVSLFENSSLVLAFGCTTLAVSGIDGGDKKKLIRFMSFVPCVAKIPMLMFLCATVLGWTVFGVVFLYLSAVFLGLVFAHNGIWQVPTFKRMTVKSFVFMLCAKIGDYLMRMGVGLAIAVTALYILQYWNLLSPVVSLFMPLFAPLGLDCAPIVIALLFGLAGKEMILVILLTFGASSVGFTTATCLSFIAFALLYTPCVPCLTAVRSQIGLRGAVGVAVFQFAVAYCASFVVYMFALFVTM